MNVKNMTVCIVEPNRFEGQIIVDLFKNAGVEKIRVVADQAAAMDLLMTYNANVVVASYEMGPLDGAAWTRAYRRTMDLPGRKQAIFITSASFSLSIAEECRHAGANALIGKPISSKVLLATVAKVLDKPRPFIDAPGYVGPCRRAGIVTAGAPKKRRSADSEAKEAEQAPVLTLEKVVEALVAATSAYAADVRHVESCEAALRFVQAYAVNAGDGPLMRTCSAFAQQVNTSRSQRNDAARGALEACAGAVARLIAMKDTQSMERDAVAEGVSNAVAKAALLRAA